MGEISRESLIAETLPERAGRVYSELNVFCQLSRCPPFVVCDRRDGQVWLQAENSFLKISLLIPADDSAIRVGGKIKGQFQMGSVPYVMGKVIFLQVAEIAFLN